MRPSPFLRSYQHVPEQDWMETVPLLYISYSESPCVVQTQLVRFPCPSLFPYHLVCFFLRRNSGEKGIGTILNSKATWVQIPPLGRGYGKLPCLWSMDPALENFVFRRDSGKEVKGRTSYERVRSIARRTDWRVNILGADRKGFSLQMI